MFNRENGRIFFLEMLIPGYCMLFLFFVGSTKNHPFHAKYMCFLVVRLKILWVLDAPPKRVPRVFFRFFRLNEFTIPVTLSRSRSPGMSLHQFSRIQDPLMISPNEKTLV